MSKVLLHSADGVPLRLISCERAVMLILKDAVIPVGDVVKVFKSVTTKIVVTSKLYLVKTVARMYQKTLRWSKRGVLARDKHKCVYCGSSADTIDHVVPRSKGGGNKWENTVACCKPCNTHKSDYDLEECGLTLKKAPHQPTLIELLNNKMG